MDRITQEAYERQRMLKYLEKHSVTETAIRYHVSRKTVWKWRKRYDNTLESLRIEADGRIEARASKAKRNVNW